MKANLKNEFLVFTTISILLTFVIIFFPSNVLQNILSLPFLLFFPGYTLLRALFPHKDDLTNILRIALSFGLSIAVVILIGIIFNYAPWGIKLYPILISLIIFNLGMLGIAWYRCKKIPQGDRFHMSINLHLPSWGGKSGADKVLSSVLVVAILGIIVTLAYVITTTKTGERLTEFYILGLEGKAELYPSEFVMNDGIIVSVKYGGEEKSRTEEEKYGLLTLTIINNEHEEASYAVEVMINGEKVRVWVEQEEMDEIGPIALIHDDKWEQEVGFAPREVGEEQKVEFVLYKNGELYFNDKEPPHLWIDVKKVA